VSVKEALEYYRLVLNILCVAQFMASLITVLQALLCEKLSVYDQIVIKNLKRKIDGYQTYFYMNCHLKWSAYIICFILNITHKYGSRIIIDVRN